ALIASIESHGGKVMANIDVTQVTVKGGRATGIATADGREFAAKDGVIGAIHPHHLGRMVPGLDPAVVAGADATLISDMGCITIHAALNEPLKFRAGDHIKAMMHVWDYVPYKRADGKDWDSSKKAYAERMLAHMGKYISNVGPDNIIAYHCDSPLDMERTSASFQRGDLHGG